MLTGFILYFCLWTCVHSQVSMIESEPVNSVTVPLLRSLPSNEDNIIYSPLSISMALGMLLEGAEGQTRNEIASMLNQTSYLSDYSTLHQNYRKILETLEEPNKYEDKFKIKLANAVMVKSGSEINSQYKKNIVDNYKALLSSENFHENGSKIVEKLNNFVKENTDNQITSAVDSIDPDTKLLLLNAIGLDAKWYFPFDKNSMQQRTFYGLNGQLSRVTFMHITKRFNYTDIPALKCGLIQLNYVKSAAMYILLPNSNVDPRNIIKKLTEQQISEYIDRAQLTYVDLLLPKFSFEQKYDLPKTMRDIGLTTAFGSHSQYTKIVNGQPLFVNDFVHKARISVDEEGTKAAAVTAIHMMPLSLDVGSLNPVVFQVDHPFIFFIKDRNHKLTLFAGVVNRL